MTHIDRPKLEQAISSAISIFADADARNFCHSAVVDAIAAELTLGISRVPGKILPADIDSYICALLALKPIPRARSNFQRPAVLSLLRVACAGITRHRFVEECDARLMPIG